MSWADYAIIAVCLASAAFGFWRGLAKEALSLATWIAAIFLALEFTWVVEPMLGRWIAAPELKIWAARALILIGVLIVGGLAAWFARELIRGIGLGGVDRAFGGVFGLARGVLIVGLAVIGLQLTGLDRDPWWQAARLKPWGDLVAERIRYYGEAGTEYLRDQDIVGAVKPR